MEKLQNGEIDLMAALSYTDERAETMLFSDLPMGKEKYYLYADLTNTDISPSDLSTLNGKRIAVMEESVQDKKADCFLSSSGRATEYVNDKKLYSVFLTQPDNISFAVSRGNSVLLSILNKTLKSMPTSKLTGALSVPIVAMTANAFEEDREKSYEAGMNGYLAKPVSAEALINTIDKIMKDN